MRFAWLKANSVGTDSDPKQGSNLLGLIRSAYNLAFWVFLAPFFTSMEYGTGFILMTAMIGIRLCLNFYTNNIFKPTPAQFERFPFRIP